MVKHFIALILVMIAGPLMAQELTLDKDFDVRLELVFDPTDAAPLEGEMILATIRGFYRETITNEELKLRRMTDFDWIQLAPDKWSEKPVDGLPTVIFERRIALFPKRSGTLKILPIAHELELINRAQNRQLMLVRSEATTLEVTAKPKGVGSDWLPVQAIEISESWSANPATLEDGQNVERRVVLRALGVAPELLPKQPEMREHWLITFTPPEERSVQLTSQGPVSTAVWVWYLRPITGEPGVIPPVDIPYFDTSDRISKSIQIPSSPIGYASFADNGNAGWQTGFQLDAKLWVGFAAGLVIALFAGFLGRNFSLGPIRRLKAWNARRLKFKKLRLLEHDGNVASFRGRMTEYLTSETTMNEAQRLELTKPLDAKVFADQDIDQAHDLRSARSNLQKLPTPSTR